MCFWLFYWNSFVNVAVARGVLTTRTNLRDIRTNRLVGTGLSVILNGSMASPITVGRVGGFNGGSIFSGAEVSLIVSRFAPGGSVRSTRGYGRIHRFTTGFSVGRCCSINAVNVRRTLLPRRNVMAYNSYVVNTSDRAYACNTLNTFSANINSASVTTNVMAKVT